MAKSAREKLREKKSPKTVELDYNFGGLKAGQKMFVGTPQIIADFILKIPYGTTRTVPAMRMALARRRKCDGTCPVSTAIFVRIAAEAALDDLADGKPVSEVIPFWRIISGDDKIATKLWVDPDWIDQQRALEARSG
ncbi:MAG: hypothetical protein AAGF33_02150 [Pseudomonadota bacterium]